MTSGVGSGTVLVERPAERVALVTLNRPEHANGVVPELARDLMAAFTDLEEDLDVGAAVLTGAGRHFSAGADLFAMKEYLEKEHPLTQEPYNARVLFPVTQRIAASRLAVVAAVNGSATAGGLDLSLACDLRIASEAARFGETYVKLGLAPANGGCWFLPRLVGSGKAAELALTGDVISAAEALEIGLVNRVVPADDLLPEALALAGRIAANPWRAVEATKQLLRSSWQADLASTMSFGYWTTSALHWTDEFKTQVEAFVNKSDRK